MGLEDLGRMQLPLAAPAYKWRFFPSQCRLPSAESVMTFLVEEGTSLPLILLVNALAFYALREFTDGRAE